MNTREDRRVSANTAFDRIVIAVRDLIQDGLSDIPSENLTSLSHTHQFAAWQVLGIAAVCLGGDGDRAIDDLRDAVVERARRPVTEAAGAGFTQLTRWLSTNDMRLLKAGRAPMLAVVPLPVPLEILATKGESA